MISFERETLVSLGDVPSLLPSRRGRRVHRATVYRWAAKGVGGVRLDVLRIGGSLFTSEQAVARFLEAQNAPHTGEASAPASNDDLVAEDREAESLGL